MDGKVLKCLLMDRINIDWIVSSTDRTHFRAVVKNAVVGVRSVVYV
jgi:hypothetical protein